MVSEAKLRTKTGLSRLGLASGALLWQSSIFIYHTRLPLNLKKIKKRLDKQKKWCKMEESGEKWKKVDNYEILD